MDDPYQIGGRKAFELLQEALIEKRAGLKKIAMRIAQGLNAKRTIFAITEGMFTDKRIITDFTERRKYAELAIAIFGARAPEKHEHTGEDGGPLIIKYVNDWRGRNEDINDRFSNNENVRNLHNKIINGD